MERHQSDVLVIGAGNAALCAAIAAAEHGATVRVLECAPRTESGGNTAYTAGSMRVAYNGVDDLLELIPKLTDDELRRTDFGTYTKDQFHRDMIRVTDGRSDPDLVSTLVDRSYATLLWMRGHGVEFVPIYGRQAFNVGGTYRFWGGLTVEVAGGGKGLVRALRIAAESAGATLHYQCRAVKLIRDGKGVTGAIARSAGVPIVFEAGAVVLASGGFEANAEWRTRYLGAGWDIAKVRGSRFNTGDGIRIALDIGAQPTGNWSGCHAVAWDLNAPDFGNLDVGNGYQKHSYPLGILVNARGERFLDEGAEFRNYTYAKYGRLILEQPRQVAWQVFDSKVTGLLREEYRTPGATMVRADTLEELADQMDGLDSEQFLRTVRDFNAAVSTEIPFNPNIMDGRSTEDTSVPKSNWANTLDEPPFEAYAVTCGITFTFGGLRITPSASVIDTDNAPIPGLFAAGELVGGLFYFNYPGGAGLTSGAVFGRLAGTGAARYAQRDLVSQDGQQQPVSPGDASKNHSLTNDVSS